MEVSEGMSWSEEGIRRKSWSEGGIRQRHQKEVVISVESLNLRCSGRSSQGDATMGSAEVKKYSLLSEAVS